LQVHQSEQRNRCWDLALNEDIVVTDITGHDGCKPLRTRGISPSEASGHSDPSALPDTLIAACGFCESSPDGEIVFRRQGSATLELGQDLCDFRTTSAKKRGGCASQGHLNRCRAHVGSMRGIQCGIRRAFA
jgi:hypothetical protein